MDYPNRVALTVLGLIVVTSILTTILTFAGVNPTAYQPYLFFIMAFAILSLFLSPYPTCLLV
jgi:hypothetical protein